ncbi:MULTISPECIES: CDGSH iron-sulfur domain-containing protein [unclassified Polaribacter]|nr:CDGSH iron-sulfur domain-containing protein [Polaribacter sp. AHE13PA]QXP72216.1 CDGSH iron-sulfur domain-containing protein [Polaribacter sp. R2A056_3_33]
MTKRAGNRSLSVELEGGNYAWCTCGLSENKPLCDGFHK